MDTTFELVRATRGFLSGKREYFKDMYTLSLNDVYFQLQFVMCDEQHITEEIEKFFVKTYKSAFMVENAENIAEWLNISIHQTSSDWIRKNRADMLRNEAKGGYLPPQGHSEYLAGREIDEMEFNKVLVGYICNLPEIYRQTALAFYFDNLSEDAIVDAFMIDAITLKNRITFIEKSLAAEIHDYCKENKYMMVSVNSQKIRTALFELSKLYKYPYMEELFQNIAVKVGLN